MKRAKMLREAGSDILTMRPSSLGKLAMKGAIALALTASMMPILGGTASANEPQDVQAQASVERTTAATPDGDLLGGQTIQQNGTYYLHPDATGVITVAPNMTATVEGSFAGNYATGAGANANVSFAIGNNSTLTIKNVGIKQTVLGSGSAFDFVGTGTLKIEGKNYIQDAIEVPAGTERTRATIHVSPSANATFSGSGELYGYKGHTASLIGADSYSTDSKREGNGKITFTSGKWYLKGSQSGATIGSDSATATNIGDITFKGGSVYATTKANGAAIGASNMGYAGNIVIDGGMVQAGTSWGGSCIGNGAKGNVAMAGKLIYKSGIVIPVLNPNAIASGSRFAGYFSTSDFKTSPGGKYLISEKGITSQMVDASGNSLAMLDVDASHTVGDIGTEIYLDGVLKYSGEMITNICDNINASTDGSFWSSYNLSNLYIFATKAAHTVKVQANDGSSKSFSYYWDGSSFVEGVQPSLSGADVTLDKTSAVYTGSAIKPNVTGVKVSGKALSASNDYTVSYLDASKNAVSSPVDAGTYYVRVTGKGSYAGTKDVAFTITPAPISSMKLSATSFKWTGKALAPKVTVYASVGGGSVALLSNAASGNASVSVSMPSAKNVGKYTVKATGTGNYQGSASATFKVNPKGTTISKLTKLKRGFTVKWKKQASQTTGYEIRYSLKKTMASSKTIVVSKAKTVSKKKTGLKSKKTYYVQIRTYKKVGGVKYVSAWSSKKSVKTK